MRSRNAEMHAHGPAGPLLPPASEHLPPVPPFCPFILYIVVQRTVLLIGDTLQKLLLLNVSLKNNSLL